MNKSLNFHPILFAVFPTLAVVADHVEFITFNKTLLLITGLVLLLTLILFLMIRRLWQNPAKASIFTSLSLLLFFSYGHAFDYLTKINGYSFIQHRHLAGIWAGLFIILFISLWRTKRALTLMNRWLTAVGLALVLLSAFTILRHELTTEPAWQPGLAWDNNGAESSTNLPDIYYIILDAYASEKTLRAYYEFDNSDFLSGLEARGFFVADESRSNYSLTSLSLSSSLNLSYVNQISEHTPETSTSIVIPMHLIENNHAMNFLRERGYHLVYLGSGYGVSQANRQADMDVRCGRVDETVGRFMATSLLRAPADRFRLVERDDRQRRLCMFARLASLPETSQPKFVFAHVPSPHWPFLFDAEGNHVVRENLTHEQLKRSYLEQLIYLNGRVTEIVDAIMENSRIEPIIIIQSDHGPAFEASMDKPSPDLFQERMRILNAYYMPPDAQAMLYPTITPVNSFRILFNYLFKADFPLLEDYSYFSTYERPYRFTNVTESIRSN